LPGSVLPSRPSPWRGLAPPPSPLRETTPHPPPAGVPSDSTPPPACPACPLAAAGPAWCRLRVSPSVPPARSPILRGFHSQEPLGPPTFCDASLPACHGLWTPADLPILATADGLVLPSVCVKTLGIRKSHVEAVPALQGTRLPLRPIGFSVYASSILFAMIKTTTPPWTQDSIRVGGSPLPDRDFHPARDAKLSWRDNAGRQARRAVGARHERTLAAVACTLWLGAGEGRDTVSPARSTPLLHRHLPRYCFNSCFSSLTKRQSVCWAMSFWGVDCLMPASCRRRA